MNGSGSPSVQPVCRFSHRAMATVYEVAIDGEEPAFAAQAAQAVFDELDRLEQELSRYLPNSDVSRINHLRPHEETRVGIDAFECLKLSRRCWASTSGAFDATAGALIDCLVGRDRRLLVPSPDSLEQARRASGMNLIELEESTHTVKVLEPVPRIDLGAVGKGYAVDRGVELLKEWGVGSALLHGGGSSSYAFGIYQGQVGWPVTMSNASRPEELLERAVLNDRALSGSGVQKGRHIVDPRTGNVVPSGRAAWVCGPTAAETDAYSTACMVMDLSEIEQFQRENPDLWVMVVREEGLQPLVLRFGVLPVRNDATA